MAVAAPESGSGGSTPSAPTCLPLAANPAVVVASIAAAGGSGDAGVC